MLLAEKARFFFRSLCCKSTLVVSQDLQRVEIGEVCLLLSSSRLRLRVVFVISTVFETMSGFGTQQGMRITAAPSH